MTNIPEADLLPITASLSDDGRLAIGGCDVRKLVEEFGSPLYIYDEATLRGMCRDFVDGFTDEYPRSHVEYSSKAFANPAVARIIEEEDLDMDVVTGGELAVAMAADFPAERLNFHGNNKGREELEEAVRYGIASITLDSFHEIDLLSDVARELGVRQKVMLRLSPSVDPHTHMLTATGILDSKFGFSIETGDAEHAVEQALAQEWLEVEGLHFHLGSPIFELEPYSEAIDYVLRFAADMRDKYGLDLQRFSPGGGFAIGYVVDRPDNAGELATLRITPRLVAKLLTQSYLGSDLGRGHPGIADNPLSIMQDPEFVRLNPGLSRINQEVGATLLSLSNQSDVIRQLTDWVTHDPTARDFIAGEPDQWGMVVNPNYEGLALPAAEIPLLDDFVPETGNTCRQENPAVYFNQIAAPVTTLRKISEALLDAHPNVQTRCELDADTGLYKVGRIGRQSYGSRFMLGLVSLGDVERYGLRAAALQAAPGKFVEPTESSLAAAVSLMEPGEETLPFTLDQAAVRTSSKAYPGTMVVYTAARMQNLDPADAAKVAQFIRVATSEGQRPGPGNGQLPAGYLPLLA